MHSQDHLEHTPRRCRRISLPPEDICSIEPQLEPGMRLDHPSCDPEPGIGDSIPIFYPRQEQIESDWAQVFEEPRKRDRIGEIYPTPVEYLIIAQYYPSPHPLVESQDPTSTPERPLPHPDHQVRLIELPPTSPMAWGQVKGEVWG